jgi:hypothetical protein
MVGEDMCAVVRRLHAEDREAVLGSNPTPAEAL